MRRTCVPVAVLASAALLVPAAADAASWSGQSVADPSGATSTELSGVACATATGCLAVGRWDDGSGLRPLGATWASSAWTLQAPSAPVGAATSELTGVSCTGVSACTAAGSADVSGVGSLAARWTGSWAIQSTPSPVGATESHITGVSCSSSSECTAVGSWTDGRGLQQTLVLRWTSGGGWGVQSSPNPSGAIATSLSGVSCDSSANCTAVGTSYNSLGTPETLAMKRTGGTGTWTIEATPNVSGASGSFLAGVSCTSSSDCTAVGLSTGTAVAPLAMTRVSGTWTIYSTPIPSGQDGAALSGVACTSSTDCLAVGYSFSGFSYSPLAETRSRTTWTDAAPPLPAGANGGQLTGVSCSARDVCTAVGFHLDSNFERRSLIDRFQ
jgi:hypothetical protein